MAETYEPIPLIRKQINGTISIPEKTWLDAWANESENNRALLQRLSDPSLIQADMRAIWDMNETRMDQRFASGLRKISSPDYIPMRRQRQKRIMIGSLSAAAAIAVLYFGLPLLQHRGIGLLETRTAGLQQLLQKMARTATAAKLSYNGDSIRYIDDSKPEERIAQVGNLLITKRERRFLAIANIDNSVTDDKTTDKAIFSIPAGETWQVLLPDNSKVFLRSGSSLSLLKSRTVLLEGTATFDIHKEPEIPFQVLSSHLQTLATGTVFTVSDHLNDQLASATLLQGRVTVDNGHDSIVLTEKQQAIVSSAKEKITLMKDTSSGEIPHWTDASFDFSHERLRTSLKRVMAFYGIKYYLIKAGVDTLTLGKLRTGPVGKDLTLNEFINEVQAPDLHIRMSKDSTTLIADKEMTK